MPRRRVLVAGSGVSRVVAARALAAHPDIVLAEADATVGGKIRTTERHDCPLDLGTVALDGAWLRGIGIPARSAPAERTAAALGSTLG
jgi:predicted NAD/FAD-binding protein